MQRKAGLSENQPKKDKNAIFAKPPRCRILKLWEVILLIKSRKVALADHLVLFLFLGGGLRTVVYPVARTVFYQVLNFLLLKKPVVQIG